MAGRRKPPASERETWPFLTFATRLRGDNVQERREAVGTLPGFGTTAVPFLVQAMGDENVGVRVDAVYALGQLGPAAADAVPDLIEAMKAEGRFPLSTGLVGTIVKIGPKAMPHLMAAANSTDPEVRRQVIEALGEFGPQARRAVPGITAALNDPVDSVRNAAAEALQKIQAEKVPGASSP